jgi:uncharacterized protein (TIGR02246 family)
LQNDESEIRALVATWMTATRTGDVDAVLSLIADDVVFLVPGRPPMHKEEFVAVTRAQATPGGPRIEGSSDIQEIRIVGDWAFMWTRLAISVTPPDGSPPMQRDGHTLSVLNKRDGRWVLVRDANLLAPAAPRAQPA